MGRVWHGRCLLLRARVWCVASPGQLQIGSDCRGPAPGPGGLCSLTQVTFQPFPSPLPPSPQLSQGGCAWSGREGVPHLLRAASTPSAPPPASCAPSAPLHAEAGLACVFLRAGCRGRGHAVHQPQAALQHRLCLPAEGTHFPVCTSVPCGLVAPQAVRSGFCPVPALQAGKATRLAPHPSSIPPALQAALPLCPEARIGLSLLQPLPSSQTKDTAPGSVLGALRARFSNPWSLTPSSFLHCPG